MVNEAGSAATAQRQAMVLLQRCPLPLPPTIANSLPIERHVLVGVGQNYVALPVQARELAHQHPPILDADLLRVRERRQ